MTLVLDLTPEEERHLEEARRRGFDVVAMLKGVIAGLPAAPQIEEDQTEQLLERWATEDATDDPEEIAAAERDLAAFKADMNTNRALSGERPVYK
jgi:hypothetical protein